MVKIANGNPDNKVMLIISGLHAREWLGITSVLYILDSLVTRFDQLPTALKELEWIFIPVLNPDGYEYTHTHDRLWRKNRRKFNTCIGVDINRNFKIDWDVPGVTVKNECNDGYSGPYPFSEAESIALRNLITTSRNKPSAMIDLHSYGQLILYPWSGNPKPTPDQDLLWKTAKGMADAINKTTEQAYEIGATYYKIYPATGAAIDWLYSVGVERAFAIESRDKGSYGFLVPPEQIESAGQEMLAAVTQLAMNLTAEVAKRRVSYYSWF